MSAVRQATLRLSLRAGFLEKREKWRTPGYFARSSKTKTTLYFPVKVAHPPVGLEPRLPVSGLPLTVGHGYDAHCVGIIEVDDGKRKAVKHEPPGSMQVFGPAPRCLGNAIKSVGDGGDESRAGVHAALQVPVVPSLNFQPRFRVEAIRLTFRHTFRH